MNSRERVLAALNHKEPDRVPFDMAEPSSPASRPKPTPAAPAPGLPEKEAQIIDIFSSWPRWMTMSWIIWEWTSAMSRPVQARTIYWTSQDSEDGQYSYLTTNIKIGWRMPKDGGWYYDMFDHPLAGEITEEDVDRYVLPDPRTHLLCGDPRGGLEGD